MPVTSRGFVAAVALALAAFAAPAAAQPRPYVVFHGRVTAIHPADGMWAGRAIARQRVEFDVEKVVSGALAVPRVSVHWTILKRTPDVDADTPQLRADLFAVNKLLEVTAEERPSPFAPGETIWSAIQPTHEIAPTSSARGRRGCPGCASSEGDGALALGTLALALALQRTRRNQ